MNNINNKQGQSLIEVVFAVGLIGVVLLGVLSLLVKTMNFRSRGYNRQQAARLAELVAEEKIGLEKTDKNSFWNTTTLQNGESGTKAGYSGYTYSVGYTIVGNSSEFPKCDAVQLNCVKMVVKVVSVGMTGDVVFERFFSKK